MKLSFTEAEEQAVFEVARRQVATTFHEYCCVYQVFKNNRNIFLENLTHKLGYD